MRGGSARCFHCWAAHRRSGRRRALSVPCVQQQEAWWLWWWVGVAGAGPGRGLEGAWKATGQVGKRGAGICKVGDSAKLHAGTARAQQVELPSVLCQLSASLPGWRRAYRSRPLSVLLDKFSKCRFSTGLPNGGAFQRDSDGCGGLEEVSSFALRDQNVRWLQQGYRFGAVARPLGEC